MQVRAMVGGMAAVLGLALPLAGGTEPAAGSIAAAACGQGSWVAGTVDLCAGELVYRDYVYDDHGASLTDLLSGPAEGLYSGVRAPIDAYGDISPAGMAELAGLDLAARDNTADLVALRLRVRGDELTVTAELNTMFDADRAQVLVGIDTDGSSDTAVSSTWPGGVLASPYRLPGQQALANRGIDTFITLSGGDPDTNLLSATVARPPGSRWRLQAVTARSVAPGGPPVALNVAFRGPDERGGWWENAQALALATNDISGFAHTVRVADLTHGVTRPAAVPAGSLRERVYISEHNPGEGLRVTGGLASKPAQFLERSVDMLGRYQPYGFYEPAGDRPHGLQFILHGLGENHSVQIADPTGALNPSPTAAKFGDALNRVVVVPLARGARAGYSSYAERDVLDVLSDVEASYDIDPQRVIMGGTSMGGYGAMRVATLHPDLFAAVVQWVGATGDLLNGTPLTGAATLGFNGNVVDLLGNLRHVPMGAMYSGLDELVHVNEALAVRDRLRELQVPSIHWLHPVATHSTYSLLNDWTKEAAWSAGRTRVRDPGRVTFRTDRRFFEPEPGLTPDRAYWVSGIVPAGDGYADVDATTHGCGAGEPIIATTMGSGTDPVPWVSQQIDVVGQTHASAANRLELTLANVSALAIDLGAPTAAPGERGACLTGKAIEYRVATDRAVTVRFSDGRTLTLQPGVHEGTVAAAAGATALAPSAPATSSGRLPATGGVVRPSTAVLLLAGLAGLALSRRPRSRRA
jgi:pimeloyl-ACP methyl ester carboxylesterase